jgi:poly(3-hydroxybutyrate) depolymerase
MKLKSVPILQLSRLFVTGTLFLLCLESVPGATVDDFAARVFVDVSGQQMAYRLFVPSNYSGNQKYPLVFWLHSEAGSGTDNRSQLTAYRVGALVFVSAANQIKHPCIMVAPQCPKDHPMWACPETEALVLHLLQELQTQFNIDVDRLYITGKCLGGSGTWQYIINNPDLFAAAVLGACNYNWPFNVRTVPVWFFEAADDPYFTTVEQKGSTIINHRRAAGATVIYTEYATGGHDITDAAFSTAPLVDWVMAQRRGRASTVRPLVTIQSLDTSLPILTSADRIALSGHAANCLDANIAQVSWRNNLDATGTGDGTTDWSISDLPLSLGTNSINVLATGPSWSSALGGCTTFNAPLAVVRLLPSPIVQSIATDGARITLSWTGGIPPFQIEASDALGALGGGAWNCVLTNAGRMAMFPTHQGQSYFRILGR